MNSEKQAEARVARREYMRRWRADHPEAVKAAQARYWAKKATEMKISASDSEAETTENE